MNIKIPQQTTDTTNLLDKISDLVSLLPEILYQNRSNGEIDFYGASFLISSHLGLEKPLYSTSTWKHGWLWYDVISPIRLVESGKKNINNLVFTKDHELYLKKFGYSRAIAVGAPFIYTTPSMTKRIPGSILVIPPHSTQFGTFDAKSNLLPYVNYIKSLRSHFSLVVGCVGAQDVIKNNWVKAFETAKIPWITGAWSFDRNALQRIRTILESFEYVTSNHPGSHFAYAAYCGCKTSFWGEDLERKNEDLLSHPFFTKNPDIAERLKHIDYKQEFNKRYPFFFVDPWRANENSNWATQALGEPNKKLPEEIAELFEWKIRKLPSGSWSPINPHDALTNEELFAKAMAKSIVGQHDEAFKLTNVLKRRHKRIKDIEIIRARFFLHNDNTHAAREALKEELRHFPGNTEAAKLFQKLGGDIIAQYNAKNEDEKEFITFLNTVRPFTRLSIKRARSLYNLALRICMENVPGNFVECGVAAGGSTILLALVVQKHSQIPRKVFAFDTFTGMPEPEEADTANGVPADDTGWGTGTCAAPEEFVQTQCHLFGVAGIVETRKGLFEDTLPVHRAEIGQIALLHMDADWYSSTKAILDNLFAQLNDNALIQIDDYGAWDGCKKAILDYSIQHDLFFDVQEIDDTGVWCAKPSQTGNMLVGTPAHPSADVFLSPRLSPDFVDLYIVRKAILDRLDQAIPLFRGTLLDVGCGQMPYREYIFKSQPLVKQYIGLDFAQGKYSDLKQPDLTWNGTTIPLDDASVDCAMATEVLEHCFNPSIVLQEIKRVLKPGGVFFFTTPFLWPIHDPPHDHYRYTPYALERLLNEAGFNDISIETLGGWNAALAQMIGLWLNRAPMTGNARETAKQDLFPLYKMLIESDICTNEFSKGPMITGLSGIAHSKNNSSQNIDMENTNNIKVVCPICKNEFDEFLPYGRNKRPNAACPVCYSVERHRLLWLYLQQKTNFFRKKISVLEIAPTKGFSDIIRNIPNIEYTSIDLHSKHAMFNMDLTDLSFEENEFDCIICYHVLEHIPDDRKAMRELCRVLKPTGWAIIQVPLLKTLQTKEDLTITSPEIRRKLYGQEDHVRYYGLDYKERLEESGFDVKIDKFASNLSPALVNRFRLKSDEDIYLCTKSNFTFSFDRNLLNEEKEVIIVKNFPKLSETFILSQMTGLLKQGHNIEIWAQKDPKEDTVHPEIEEHSLLTITKYVKLPKLDQNEPGWSEAFCRLNKIDPSVIRMFHVHFGVTFNEFSPLFSSMDRNVIVSFHGADASEYLQQHGSGYYEKLFQRANVITVPSEAMKRILVDNGCSNKKIVVHRYGVDLENFRPSRHQKSTEEIIFLSVARLVEKKGLTYSLKAFANLQTAKKTTYQIIGEGPLEMELKELCQALNIKDRVVFLGEKDKESVQYHMQKAHVFVLTSVTADSGDQEGLPVTLIEAHASGLPAISTYHAGIPELIVDGKTGFLCEEKSVSCITEKMKELVENDNIRNELSINAEKRVAEKFNIATLNIKLSSIYKSL